MEWSAEACGDAEVLVNSHRIAFEDVRFAYEEKEVLHGVSVIAREGQVTALVGPNGAGKSTLMKLMAHKISPDTGQIELGQSVSEAYYAQHQLEELDPATTVMAELDSVAPGWTTSEERRLLGAFLFHGDDVEKRIQVLSGGERARLALAKMLVSPDPLLLLDEPTNHLDIDSVDVLEKALVDFPGTIVLISHDEHLVRALANKVVDVRDHKITVYEGDYEYFCFKRAELEAAEALSTKEGAADTGALKYKAPTVYGSDGARAEKRREAPISTSRNVKTKEQRRARAGRAPRARRRA